MTKIKLNGSVANAALEALSPHVNRLYASLGTRIVVIAELSAAERNQIADDEDKEPAVTLTVKHLEVASDNLEDDVREALRALHTHRTAYGKLTEDNDIELSENTLAQLAGSVNATEAARLHVGIERWTDYGRQALGNSKLTQQQMRAEFDTVNEALRGLIYPEANKVKG